MASPKQPLINDRKLVQEWQDKHQRFLGASWEENRGSVVQFDDFTESGALSSGNPRVWTATDTAGGGANNVAFAYSASAGAPVAAVGGWLRGTCSDNAAGVTELAGTQIMFRPDKAGGVDGGGMLTFETRVNLVSVAATNVCFGMFNAVTAGNGLALNNASTTAITLTTMTNGAGWFFDTRGTTPVFYGASADNSVVSAANTTVAATAAQDGSSNAPAAGASYVFRIEIDILGNSYYYYEDIKDQPSRALVFPTVGGYQAAAGSTLKATLLTPYAGVDNAAAGATKSLDIDYIFTAQSRV